ncbi:MAG: hypothetical protein GY928_11555 [Colwellia sp.]|nr:hypothetical protein [Colwellia sp.]
MSLDGNALANLLAGGSKKTGGNNDYKGFRVYAKSEVAGEKGVWIQNVSCAKGDEGEAYTRRLLEVQVQLGLIGTFEDQEADTVRKVANVSNLDEALTKLLQK